MPTVDHFRYFTSIKLLLISLLFVTFTTCLAQVSIGKRLELLINSPLDQYYVTGESESGITLFRLLDSPGENQLEVIRYDTSFQKKWSGFIPVANRLNLIRTVSHTSHESFLFAANVIQDANFYIIDIDIATKNYETFTVRNIIPVQPTFFERTNSGFLIGGYFGRIPVVMFFNTKTLQSKILPGLFNEVGELTQIQVHENNFDVLISAKNFQKQKTIWVKNYDSDGNLISNIMINPGEGNSLLFGRSIRTNNENVIAGVYGNRNSEYSRGLFVSKINDAGEQSMTYYNFADLENFFSYMRERREQRIKERISRKKIKGKKIKFSYRLLVHELREFDNQFFLLGEAFYLKYRTVPGQTYGSFSQNNMIFDGYQYTHAIVIGINASGKIIWDNSFEIPEVKTFQLNQFVKISEGKSSFTLFYHFNNRIRIREIIKNNVIDGETIDPENLFRESSKKSATNITRVNLWYPNTLIASGFHTEPKSDSGQAKISFFLQKISLSQ